MFRNSVDTVKYNYIIVYTSTGYFSKFHREIVFVCSNYTIFIEIYIYIYINECRHKKYSEPQIKASNTTPDAPEYHKQYNAPYLNE